MATATTSMGALDHFVREELPSVVHESLPAIAPIYKYVKQTSEGVKQSEIGRGWTVIHLYGGGVSGLMETSNPNGPGMISTEWGTNLTRRLAVGTAASNLAPFPTARNAPHTGSLKRELTLHMMTGNFSLPVLWFQGDALGASQVRQVTRDIQGVGKLRALLEAQSFFAYSASDGTYNYKVLGRVSATAETDSNNNAVITVDEEYGRIQNFRVGQTIDIVADSSGSIQSGTAVDGTDIRNTTGSAALQLTITDVDYIGKKFTCVAVNNSTGAQVDYDGNDWGATGNPVAANDWIVLAGSTQTAASRPVISWGLEDWIASEGTIMGGASGAEALDLDVYSQFKSQVVAVNAPLTDTIMNGYIGGFLEAYPDQSIDTILTTQGVTLKYLEQPTLGNNRFIYDRTDKALSLKGGWDDINYSFNGRMMKWIISPMALQKRLYAIKLGSGNIKRYVPPAVGGKDSRIGGEVQFLAPMGGHSGIFMVSRDSSTAAPEALLEAPFWQYKLCAPVDVKSVKLTGITEATMY